MRVVFNCRWRYDGWSWWGEKKKKSPRATSPWNLNFENLCLETSIWARSQKRVALDYDEGKAVARIWRF